MSNDDASRAAPQQQEFPPILTGALNVLERAIREGNFGLPGEVLAALEYVKGKLRDQKRAIKELEQEVRDTAREAASEAAWKERQGEDYGSF